MTATPTADLLADLAATLPRAFQYPEHTAVRIQCGMKTVTNDDFSDRAQQLSARTQTTGGVPIAIDVVSLEDRPQSFTRSERTLVETLTQLLSGYLERERIQDQDDHQRPDKYEFVVDRMSDVFTALDSEGRITYLNEGGRRAIIRPLEESPSREELIGQYFWGINPRVSPKDIAETKLYKSCQQAMERQEMVGHEKYYEDDDLWVYTRVYPSKTGLTIFSRDITERKKKEERLREQVEQLTEYQRQIERLEEFAGVLSHDLRNPLNVAQGNLEMARETGDTEYLEEVSRCHDRMGVLIEDLLALARGGQAIETTTRVDLGEVATTCWKHVETDGAALEVEIEQLIQADRKRLTQLFENLFRNAVEHGGPTVTVSVLPAEDGFAVVDDGPGIPPADRERIFEVGYSTNPEGTGFGLQIVAEIVEAHGWTITVDEEPDGGARFEITGCTVAESRLDDNAPTTTKTSTQ